jgi:hypothetical protein
VPTVIEPAIPRAVAPGAAPAISPASPPAKTGDATTRPSLPSTFQSPEPVDESATGQTKPPAAKRGTSATPPAGSNTTPPAGKSL